jgi:hypothetical protein
MYDIMLILDRLCGVVYFSHTFRINLISFPHRTKNASVPKECQKGRKCNFETPWTHASYLRTTNCQVKALTLDTVTPSRCTAYI